MKILFDTVNSDFYMALISNEYKLIEFIHYENIKEKVELIPDIFNKLLKNNNVCVDEVKEFYLNIGPGSFTGSRISLVFCRTIVKIKKNIKIFTINNFIWLANKKESHEINIYAGGKNFFCANVENFKIASEISLKEEKDFSTNKNYKLFEANILDELNRFEHKSNIDEIEPFYFKNPQIGTGKE
ncbi:hypothetical protein [[Mycoplasma] mobile]|uniref:Expressed protein n=1 Tax=Mycoplasma mobile (strain ATCC 43663 / 163K / NCTC 11711) TaxID=267748 RepID=Q6KIF9_MYCM1|nr:hypothetical protein [[Mycoplasma] mobile]AAT27617.1 expressed protein [Mycoplasma mobile 163K]